MLLEQWTRWEPMGLAPSPRYRFVSFVNDLTTFKITLTGPSDPEHQVFIIFEKSAYLFQKTKLQFKEKTFARLRDTHGSKFLEWNFFIITNLQYAQELEAEVSVLHDSKEFTHFAFILEDSVFEVLSLAPHKEPITITSIHEEVVNAEHRFADRFFFVENHTITI